MVDVFLNKGVEDFQALVEALLRHETLGGSGAGNDGLHVLDFGEGVGEFDFRVFEAVDAVA